MFFKLKLFSILSAMLFTLSGCGDLLGKKVAKKDLSSSFAKVNCDLDVDRFSEIMHKNIASDIRCLGENLNLFIRIVKSEKPGTLSRRELESYLRDFRPDVGPEVVKALKAVFDVGHLITGEDSNYISKKIVDQVIDFALVFNREAAISFEYFRGNDTISYALHQIRRARVSQSNKAIVQELRKIFRPDLSGNIRQLNIIDLLESFSTERTRQSIDNAKKLLFIKKVLVGGHDELITHYELERLILNFDYLSLIALDIVKYPNIKLDQRSILQLLSSDVNALNDIIRQLGNRDNEILLRVDQLIEAFKIFVKPESFNVDEYKVLIEEAKKIVMGGDGTHIRGADLNRLFTHAKTILQTGNVFYRIYAQFLVQLSQPGPVNINFNSYRDTYPEHQQELKEFERIVKKYRFMKGEFISPFYGRTYKRNADGVFEIALIEYALKLLFKSFGSPSPNGDAVGGYSINKEQMRNLFLTFENELIDLDIVLPQRAVGTADNVSLLGTLFQNQSDKNGVMDVNEATEFALSFFTSQSIADEMSEYFKEKKCGQDRFGRFESQCVKNNFWKALCTKYRTSYPLMFEYLNAPPKCEDIQNTPLAVEFLEKSINAARTCNNYTDGAKEEIPYSKGDFSSVLLAIIHAETTVLRWDTNGNNFMDASEVERAYEIYSPALDGFLEDKPAIIKKFKKQIYQYMIKYEEVPDESSFGSIWKFVKFIVSFKKKAPAYRKTIVAILDALGKENAKMETGPQFNCNYLRDPTNIPRDVNQLYTPAVNTAEDFSYLLNPYIHLAN